MFGRRIYTRYLQARRIREEAATLADRRPNPYLPAGQMPNSYDHLSNGEEFEYRDAAGLSYIANYSKGLPHDCMGEVDRIAYEAMLRALTSGGFGQFEQIPLGTTPGGLKLVNPQAGLAFDLEGPDAQSLIMPPAPRIDGPENAGEMGELYWMAVCRDVNFHEYGTNAGTDASPFGTSRTGDAAASLNTEFSVFRGPKVGGTVTSVITPATPGKPPVQATLFRGITRGDLIGPYISQFLLKDIPYVTQTVQQRYLTAPTNPATGRPDDFLTAFPDWLNAQNGAPPPGSPPNSQPRPVPPARYISNLRDLATYVHFDRLYEEYLNAVLILLNILPSAPFDRGNPYVRSRTQDGFATFGPPHILTLVAEVANRALKAVWFQKWGFIDDCDRRNLGDASMSICSAFHHCYVPLPYLPDGTQ